MAAALLSRRLPGVEVASAGSMEAGHPASEGSVRAMASRRLDLSGHRSQVLSAELIEQADLVICMGRRNLREVAVTAPAAFSRTYTLRELVRRGESVGPATSLEHWLTRVGEDRRTSDLLGDDPLDDVADPIGGPDEDYRRTATQLEELIERLGTLLDPLFADVR